LYSVVFICTGNMCRSPMAEGILKKRLAEIGRTDITVSSMGIHAPQGQKASADAVAVSAQHGIDLSEHGSRQLIFDELKTADFIFVMEKYHKEFIRTFVPQIEEKIGLLGAWPGKEKKEHGIPDPIGGKLKEYEKTYETLNRQIERMLPFLLAELI
jgi:protein-tyrosine-phosphatase